MIKQLKRFAIQMIAGANMASVAVMLFVGYSDRLDPTAHPLLSTLGMAFPILLLINLAFLLFWLMFKWRNAWIPVLGYILAYVPISIYMPLSASRDVPADAMKLISYNVCGYSGNEKHGDNGFEFIRDYLRDASPDIVCTQEENDTWRNHVMEEYHKVFPYNDSMVICNNVLSLNALGIHTRYPIVKRERIDYESMSNGSVAWWLRVGDDTLIVVNNHFESCHLNHNDRQQYRQILHGEVPRDSFRAESRQLWVKLAEANSKRAPQIRAVKRYAEQHRQYPVVICGDFNDTPISYSRHAMAESFTDCYVATGRGVGVSYNQRAFEFRIDHIFCSDRLEPLRCEIDDGIDASDHNPLLCWLKMKPKP